MSTASSPRQACGTSTSPSSTSEEHLGGSRQHMAATQPQRDQESLGDIGRQIADDAARLVRMEIELAKAGLGESLKRGGVAIALGPGALPLSLVGTTPALAALPQHFSDRAGVRGPARAR